MYFIICIYEKTFKFILQFEFNLLISQLIVLRYMFDILLNLKLETTTLHTYLQILLNCMKINNFICL